MRLVHDAAGAVDASPGWTELGRDLVDLARHADDSAWTAFVSRHYSTLERAAARKTGSSTLAADAVQETLLSIHHRLGTGGDLAADDWRSWTAAVLRNKAVDLIRAQRRHVPINEAMDDGASAPAAAGADPEVLARLRGHLDRLPEAQRQALRLRFTDGHDNLETGRHMGLSEPAVAVLVHRGLRALQRDLLQTSPPIVVLVAAALGGSAAGAEAGEQDDGVPAEQAAADALNGTGDAMSRSVAAKSWAWAALISLLAIAGGIVAWQALGREAGEGALPAVPTIAPSNGPAPARSADPAPAGDLRLEPFAADLYARGLSAIRTVRWDEGPWRSLAPAELRQGALTAESLARSAPLAALPATFPAGGRLDTMCFDLDPAADGFRVEMACRMTGRNAGIPCSGSDRI